MPLLKQTEKINDRIDIISNPLYVIKQWKSGERHGPEEWQYHHRKARDATNNVIKRGYKTIAQSWIKDPVYRETQRVHGWTLEYCIFLDCLNTVDISMRLPEKNELDTTVNTYWGGKTKRTQEKSIHDDFKMAARSLATVKQQEGQEHAYIPPKSKIGQKPIDEQFRSQLRLQCQKYQRIHGSQASSSSDSTTWWERRQWQERQNWHGWQDWDGSVNTTTNFRTRDFFSCGSRLESSSQQESLCLTKSVIRPI